MNTWKALPAAIVLSFGATSLAYALPISLQDVTNFNATGMDAPGDYDDHGWGTVNILDGTGDYVSWTHSFLFNPSVDTILSATLGLNFQDDKYKNICFFGCKYISDAYISEFGIGYGEDGTWDIGEIDTGLYQ